MIDCIAFRNRVLACENLDGVHVESIDSAFSEIFARIGFDYLWIDTEHTAMDYTHVQSHINVCHAMGAAALVRVHMNDINHTKRILEMGPAGIIFPMVNTAEMAAEAMASCLYPPLGKRGFGPKGAAHFGVDDIEEYISEEPKRLSRFIQIEHVDAVRNLREIVKNPYIDGYIFGPCDLCGSIGKLPNYKSHENIALIKEAISILKDNNKCIGLSIGSIDPEEIHSWRNMGINMISTGGDYNYAVASAKKYLADFRKAK